jgi:hypothetical protein
LHPDFDRRALVACVPRPHGFVGGSTLHQVCELLGLTAKLRNVDIAWSGRAAKFEALQQRIDGVVDALSEYQRVQRAETEVHA